MKTALTVENLISTLLIIVAFSVAVFFIRRFFRGIVKKAPNERIRLYKYVERAIIWLLAICAITVILSAIPALKSVITSVIAGSGAVALIISIASQDAISNFVSGIIIVFSKPFKVGDKIEYLNSGDCVVGIVEEIKIRHTVIRTYENTHVIVPNSLINNTAIENYTFSGDERVCVHLMIDVTYESDINKAMFILGAVIAKNPNYIDRRTEEEKLAGNEPVMVRIIDFGESGVRIKAWAWAKNPDAAIDMKSEILLELKKRYDANNISFAYPHVEVVSKRY